MMRGLASQQENLYANILQEHVLRAVKHDGHGTFIIHPDFKLVDDIDHTSPGSLEPEKGTEDPKVSAQRRGDTIEVEGSLDANAEARGQYKLLLFNRSNC